ncbi:MAG TPA: hypothetical protein VJ724_09410 [Tahibacter sp.]|nr:hypothetical protein [Tahibacter sp.]
MTLLAQRRTKSALRENSRSLRIAPIGRRAGVRPGKSAWIVDAATKERADSPAA